MPGKGLQQQPTLTMEDELQERKTEDEEAGGEEEAEAGEKKLL